VQPNVEFIVTLRCKVCGTIVSLEVPLDFEKSKKKLQAFLEKHAHREPWIA